ncbi:MAG: hypothetical protein EOO10_06425 [Chitinophagaceae bacterium]|nr:MAG: hypothetical protein EOO10_06425 [Chitinophagaceae bacterium]
MQDRNDKRLDIPSEANREKHINFLEAEEKASNKQHSGNDHSADSDDNRKRREEWQKGLEEGEKARRGEQ